jgi:hypothetical protein
MNIATCSSIGDQKAKTSAVGQAPRGGRRPEHAWSPIPEQQ